MENKKSPITFAYIASCGIEFASAIAVSTMIGIWMDRYFDKSPLFLIIFFIIGCIAGYFNILRYAADPYNKKDQS